MVWKSVQLIDNDQIECLVEAQQLMRRCQKKTRLLPPLSTASIKNCCWLAWKRCCNPGRKLQHNIPSRCSYQHRASAIKRILNQRKDHLRLSRSGHGPEQKARDWRRHGILRRGIVRVGIARHGTVRRCTIERCTVRSPTVRCSAVRRCTVRCSAVRCSAVRCSAVRCSAVRCSAVRCSAVRCSTVRCSTVRCSAVRCSTVRCSTLKLAGSALKQSGNGRALYIASIIACKLIMCSALT